jgi:type III secretion system YscI/HrpB-like protein
MLPLNLSMVDAAAPLAEPVGFTKVGRTEPTTATGQRFYAALDRAVAASAPQAAAQSPPPVRLAQAVQAPQSAPAVQPAQAVPAPPSSTAAKGVGAANDTSAEERARRTLQLESSKSTDQSSNGDVILEGLQKLRGVFDAQQGRINNMISQPILDANSLMAMQLELVNFSLLVDVTSKLTGKSTQAFDTLLKGQ